MLRQLEQISIRNFLTLAEHYARSSVDTLILPVTFSAQNLCT